MNAYANAARNAKASKERRRTALERAEFKEPSAPRVSAAGVTSFPVKIEDKAMRQMIDEALARKKLPTTTNQA